MDVKTLYTEFYWYYIKTRLKPNTQRGYRVNIEKHYLPFVGELELYDINYHTLDNVTDQLLDKGLSARSVVYVHATARKMFAFAVRRGYLMVSPYDAYDLPRVPEYHHKTVTMTEIRAAVKAAEGTVMYAPLVLAAMYGLRRGEVLGLKPSDFDPASSTLYIQRTRNTVDGQDVVTDCKTKHSRRYVLIAPEHAPIFSVSAPVKGEYVVNMSSEMLDKRWSRFRAMLPKPFHKLRFHDLRHSYATAMMLARVNPKIVSEALGHSGIGITLDLYSHPDVSMQQQLLDVITEKRT